VKKFLFVLMFLTLIVALSTSSFIPEKIHLRSFSAQMIALQDEVIDLSKIGVKEGWLLPIERERMLVELGKRSTENQIWALKDELDFIDPLGNKLSKNITQTQFKQLQSVIPELISLNGLSVKKFDKNGLIISESRIGELILILKDKCLLTCSERKFRSIIQKSKNRLYLEKLLEIS